MAVTAARGRVLGLSALCVLSPRGTVTGVPGGPPTLCPRLRPPGRPRSGFALRELTNVTLPAPVPDGMPGSFTLKSR